MKQYWITATELNKKMDTKGTLVFDCRFQLTDASFGQKEYEKEHIPGAYYVSLNEDLSSEVKEHGGRHPLPDKKDFVKLLEKFGATNTDEIVVYDDGSYAYAARFWWLLTWVGHKKVRILSGGFSKYKALFETEKQIPSLPKTTKYVPHFQDELHKDIEDIKTILKEGKDTVIIDSREANRYRGEIEPIDKKAGRIPSAVSYFYAENMKDGEFLSQTDLQKRFEKLPRDKEIIVYCGSGVTACVNLLALQIAEYDNVKLYPGSYSDWSSYDENLVEKG